MRRFAYIATAIPFLFCSLLAFEGAIAQQANVMHKLDTIPKLDTMRMIGAIHSIDTAGSSSDTGGFHMKKSALEAILLSAAFPGAGQVYLGQAWKLPFLYGLIGGFGYGVYIQNLRYHNTINSIDSLNARMDISDSNYAQDLGSNREFYLDDRDKWWIYLGLTYIANILDAYIGANLYDFDVSDPTPTTSSFRSYYDPTDRSVGLSFTIKF